MIRLSELTALDILSEKSIDINANKMHCYEIQYNNRVNKQIVMNDSYLPKVNTRRYSSCPFLGNVLLGTSNFYPENGLSLPDYHANSKLQTLLNDQVLPLLEVKNARWYFGQGLLNDSTIRGHWLKVYCKMSDSSEVVLASIVDFRNDTNAIAVPAKYFESQIYNEAIDFEFIDIDYLTNSGNAEVEEIRNLLFGDSEPLQYFIEYGNFTDDGIDDFTENGYSFQKVSMRQINQQSLQVNVGGEELIASIKLASNDFVLQSKMYHEQFNISDYMNMQKHHDEKYEITYAFIAKEYVDANLINISTQTLFSNDFETQIFRPLISNQCEYAQVELTIRVHNTSTGMVFRRETSMILTEDVIKNFKALPSISLNVTSTTANKIVNRQVQKIVQSSESPKILKIENRIYVQSQPLETVVLLNGTFVAELKLSETVNAFKKLYLKIGNLVFENLQEAKPLFEISENAYYEQSTRYLLLDENMRTISSGLIVRNLADLKSVEALTANSNILSKTI